MLDKDTSLAEKLWMLFWEQGITIASVCTAIGMAIGVLVEMSRPSGGGTGGTAGKPLPKDEKGSKEWVKYKLKASTLLQRRLRVKATSMSIGCKYWRLALHVHNHQEVKIILRCIIIKFNVRDNTRLLQFQ